MYAEATETQKVADFCGSIRRTLEFLDGVPRLIVPDNLKSAIIKFRTDDMPILNESFRDLAEHYNVGVLPARPLRPRDKPKAEGSVAMLQRSVFGRNETSSFTVLLSSMQRSLSRSGSSIRLRSRSMTRRASVCLKRWIGRYCAHYPGRPMNCNVDQQTGGPLYLPYSN